ncbi:permease [Clostridium oryzae]|uniref:Putative two-component membrane permease complex subunit n=1 Tax=Clostridium oryzae TaxID=1450648 RepID=A0A1V4IU32_9CLOT|nr:permease [Clostridium oryzae]OPJ63446.1 putative two-component membrane permease complex subunit [Clostridium oryzae]
MFTPIQIFADWLIYNVLEINKESRLGSALDFFVFDTIKIFILLLIIIYVITFIRSFFPPEKTRKILARSKGNTLAGHVLAALLGIVTPFCSCSAVPLFIGFVEAGVPLGVTFSFLIAAPMVNEVALGLLYSLFGLKIALFYVVSGEIIAIISGIIIGKLKMEKHVESYVYEMQMNADVNVPNPTSKERIMDSWNFTKDLIKKIWIYVVIGIAIGGVMHGWIPAGALARYAGENNPFAVFIAVAIGIPLYSNAAGVIPLVSELTRAGVSMGTSLAFMMAVTGLSLPEGILLRRVLKPKLLAVFYVVVGLGIVFTGYLFNIIIV